MRRLAVLALLILAAVASGSDAGTCTNPDSSAAGGGAAKPCGGSMSVSATPIVEPIKATPKTLAAAIADAPGVALLLLHKGDKCVVVAWDGRRPDGGERAWRAKNK
jgi:hypothetical protein